MLLAVATFGVGFAMRPIGAAVLGSLADRRGRKVALSVTILMMAVGTAMIGLAPTHAVAGAWAPAIIVLARLIQGFSAGGEFGAATAFLLEHAPPDRRGFYASWQQAGQAGALLVGSVSGVVLTGALSPAALESWGWRVPFLLGVLIGPIGFYIRARTDEPAEFRRADRRRSRLTLAVGSHWRGIAAGFGITITWTVCTYFFLVYMPTYAVREHGIAQRDSFLANGACLLVLLVLVPVFGAYSDRIGRRTLLLGSVTVIIVLTMPSFAWLADNPSFGSLLALQLCFAVVFAAFTGVAPAAMAEVCPAEVMSTSMSIAYSLAVAIFDGFAPFIATWLIAQTGDKLSPTWYVTASCVLSGLMIFALYRNELVRRATT
ncbi:MAG: MFS transporter [Actinophytocola sp.]|uniref:MFS transporter n=1 Tax=Actinophytocola sp. TaxID=1872138 RepID=UPI003D6B825C